MKYLILLLILIFAFSFQAFAMDFTVNLTTDQPGGGGFSRILEGNGENLAAVGISAFEVKSSLSQCTYSLSAFSASIRASGGTGSVNVIAGEGCNWTAVSNVSWITITSGSNGSGNGSVSFSVAANTGLARTGTITIAGQTFTVTQASGCAITVASESLQFSAQGGSGTFAVTAPNGCNWTATTTASWITITDGAGSGNGAGSFTVAANAGPARTGTISVAGQNFTVNQASGCTYSLSSNNAFFPVGGGTGSFNVITAPGCAWTAQTSAFFITITSGASGVGNGTVTYTVPSNPSLVRSGTIVVAGQIFTVGQDENSAPPVPKKAMFDFDGDGKSDFSIYRPETGEWWYLRSSDGGNVAVQFGTSTDKIVPADYTGDGKTDFAFFQPFSGRWFILRSEDFSFYSFPFGLESDIPVPADYDGDGKADPAVFRPSTSVWYILKSTGGITIELFGTGSSGDIPVPADYDGDGRADIAVYNPSIDIWKIKRVDGEVSFIIREQTDKPVPADYTGDGKADIALYDPVTNEWLVIRSEDQSSFTVKFGTSRDIPTPGDYDGDGKTDFAIFRPSTATWWYAASSANGQQRAREFGVSTDIPVPSAYVR
jgi:hypothetical protein